MEYIPPEEEFEIEKADGVDIKYVCLALNEIFIKAMASSNALNHFIGITSSKIVPPIASEYGKPTIISMLGEAADLPLLDDGFDFRTYDTCRFERCEGIESLLGDECYMILVYFEGDKQAKTAISGIQEMFSPKNHMSNLQLLNTEIRRARENDTFHAPLPPKNASKTECLLCAILEQVIRIIGVEHQNKVTVTISHIDNVQGFDAKGIPTCILIGVGKINETIKSGGEAHDANFTKCGPLEEIIHHVAQVGICCENDDLELVLKVLDYFLHSDRREIETKFNLMLATIIAKTTDEGETDEDA